MEMINPFSIQGSVWILWLGLGVLLGWLDFRHKISVGYLSLASLVTVLFSFTTPLTSQVLVFLFSASIVYVLEHVHEAHKKQKQYYVH